MCFIQVVPNSYMVASCHPGHSCFFPSSPRFTFPSFFFPILFRVAIVHLASYRKFILFFLFQVLSRPQANASQETRSQMHGYVFVPAVSNHLTHKRPYPRTVLRCCFCLCLIFFFCFDAKLSAKPRIVLNTQKKTPICFFCGRTRYPTWRKN